MRMPVHQLASVVRADLASPRSDCAQKPAFRSHRVSTKFLVDAVHHESQADSHDESTLTITVRRLHNSPAHARFDECAEPNGLGDSKTRAQGYAPRQAISRDLSDSLTRELSKIHSVLTCVGLMRIQPRRNERRHHRETRNETTERFHARYRVLMERIRARS